MTLKILPPVHEILRAVNMNGIDEIYQARLAREVLGRFREKLQAEPRAFRDRASVQEAIVADLRREADELRRPSTPPPVT